MSKRILVVLEEKDGKLRNVSLEALTLAGKLSEGGEVQAVLFSPKAASSQNDIGQHGADTLYVVEGEDFQTYTPDAYSQALVQLIEQAKPDVILAGHTAIGKDVAPRVAARLQIGLVSDCTGVEMQEGRVVFTRPIYAGKAFQQKAFLEGMAFATLRANNFEVKQNVRQAQMIPFEPVVKDLRTMIREVVQKTAGTVDLSEAKIIISGGRGVKSAEGFKPLQELAAVLGGAVGASRGACDAEYCDYSLQIGQTGKVVTPDLYIACGISGAIQHLAGMSNAKVIVAINKDPEAPIFQVADYGIVGDLFEVVPLLTEECKKALQMT